VVGLLLTFFFPCFGFLYSTNYVWAVFALFIDVVNFFLLFLFGFGLVTGLLWRLLALVISNHGIDRYRYRKSIRWIVDSALSCPEKSVMLDILRKGSLKPTILTLPE